jgi:thiamine kinase
MLERGDDRSTTVASASTGLVPAAGMSGWQAPDPAHLRRVGRGVSADVLLLPPDRVLKLLRTGLGAEVAQREFEAARIAFAAGLPVPEPLMLAQAGDRHGIVFERLEEPPLARAVRRLPGPVTVTLAAMARLQARTHAVRVAAAALPDARALLDARCADSLAPGAAREAARRMLGELGGGDSLLHGDLHLGNVITAGGRMMAVDWAQAMVGDPAGDVARTELLLRYGRYGAALQRHPTLRIARHAAAEWYLFCYRRITGMPAHAIDRWRLPTAVAWMRGDSAAHAPSLAAFVERQRQRDQLR